MGSAEERELLRAGFFSGNPAERQTVVDAVTDFCRAYARENGLQLPLVMIDGCVPLYESDLLAGKGKPQPDLRQNLRERVWESPFAVPSPFVNAESAAALLAKRTPEVAAKLKELVDAATASVLASQDRRIASMLLDSTYMILKVKLAKFIGSLPWGTAGVDGKPPAEDDGGGGVG